MKREIAKLVTNGFHREAMSLYSKLHSDSLPVRRFPFSSLLKSCAKLDSTHLGEMVHTHLIKTGFCSDVYNSTALIDLYMKLGDLGGARKVFDEMPQRNVVSLNAVISGLSRNGQSGEAFRVFRGMVCSGFRPNSGTLAGLCCGCESVGDGAQVHCCAIKFGVLVDVYVGTSVVTMYSKHSRLVSARKVFGEMAHKSVVSYNAFMTALLQNGDAHVVFDVFKDMMRGSGDNPSAVSLVSVLSACASLSCIRFGVQVHGLAVKMNMGLDTVVGNAVLNMYSKCGSHKHAYDVFKEMDRSRDLVTWNSMILGLMSSGEMEKAVELFERLQHEGLKPDSVTWNTMVSGCSQQGKPVAAIEFFNRMQSSGTLISLKSITSLLQACSDLSALDYAKQIHAFTTRNFTTIDEFVTTALIDTYMKCGHFSSARRFFDQLGIKTRDPAIWNSLINGYGRNGENESAFEIFSKMQENNVTPNAATFVSVLSVCSHSGEVDKGYQIFKTMKQQFGVNPGSEHFSCIVDLLGRSGRLEEARELIEGMEDPPVSVFASLLGACRCYGDFRLGEEMAMRVSELEAHDPSPFVVLSNIYADLGMWEEVERIREVMRERGLKKGPGYSSV